MSALKTEAIVLRRYDWSESSQILHVLTPDRGRLSLLAKGIKKPNAALKGPADVFQRAEISHHLRRGELGLLVRYEPLTGHPDLRSDLQRLFAAFHLIDIAWALHRDGVAAPTAYGVLARVLFRLEEVDEFALRPLVFAAQLRLFEGSGFGLALDTVLEGEAAIFSAEKGGLLPLGADAGVRDRLPVDAGTAAVLRALAQTSPAEIPRIRLDARQSALLHELFARWQAHLFDRPLPSGVFFADPRFGRRRPQRPSVVPRG